MICKTIKISIIWNLFAVIGGIIAGYFELPPFLSYLLGSLYGIVLGMVALIFINKEIKEKEKTYE